LPDTTRRSRLFLPPGNTNLPLLQPSLLKKDVETKNTIINKKATLLSITKACQNGSYAHSW
jgi:hypothetical protein